ncbi:MAG: hypothetical protein CVU55_06040 [Deltaproteobacteria bacterium HGW-Deltaproteobacteria-13]|jgi:hypothetical protein|nr:MAG: hypothetical protein CVU55_06040 [Deltaproteobacteria bacterium HGW-Deltaproteobacteria-13]
MSYHLNLKRYFAIGLSIVMLSGTLFFGLAKQAQAEDRKGWQDNKRVQKQDNNRGQWSSSRQIQPRDNNQGQRQINKQIQIQDNKRGQWQDNKLARTQNYRREQGFSAKGTPGSQHNNFIDSRYQHNRSYPAHGESFRSLPRDYRMVRHGHSRYYTYNGVWYRPYGGQYVVIAPPFGLFVPFLPLFYTTIWLHGIPYYYANDTYYTQAEGGYVVVEPPQEDVSENPPPTDDSMENKLFIYPRKGQSEEKQANDRYECHKWSVTQTNYDPTNISGIPADQITQKRIDYRRAMTACLDARGYTAK